MTHLITKPGVTLSHAVASTNSPITLCGESWEGWQVDLRALDVDRFYPTCTECRLIYDEAVRRATLRPPHAFTAAGHYGPLAQTLRDVRVTDEALEDPHGPDGSAREELYMLRRSLLARAIGQAQKCGCDWGFRLDPEEPLWPVLYIELPTGQVSWHMPQHEREWDGHSTAEKLERIRAFAEGLPEHAEEWARTSF